MSSSGLISRVSQLAAYKKAAREQLDTRFPTPTSTPYTLDTNIVPSKPSDLEDLNARFRSPSYSDDKMVRLLQQAVLVATALAMHVNAGLEMNFNGEDFCETYEYNLPLADVGTSCTPLPSVGARGLIVETSPPEDCIFAVYKTADCSDSPIFFDGAYEYKTDGKL